ncbi:AFL224Wp [Eremothecium gossypii ATCC 10895]|uniref:AFL224Wp n=1 Tax=Eremothecium gossypii (strain ATCC 10895 / CBS 109.51 / FGSC 9923 / NRRL Y-1056) TaxID=284811 RepID=Q755N7_EREGS|nr:AFL224Wp [Eremothecium gossypii ATCC 10895]AAS53150.1 AFL224Wp [Eremothecium gossypii ATCC 10895]AEY97460.1 FAFL224Wp [Eremothecium gossypii FDAG1]
MARTTKHARASPQPAAADKPQPEPVSDAELDGFSDSDAEPSVTDEQPQPAAAGHTILPQQPARRSGAKKQAARTDLSGIIYISRLPHGFHERELSTYFAQFGDLKQVRLARNKKTGNSRHYAFIEFANPDDAVVAQETMHNYLLMGHLLQVSVLPKGRTIEKLYKHKKRVHKENSIKDAARTQRRADAAHAARMQKLRDAGIDLKW